MNRCVSRRQLLTKAHPVRRDDMFDSSLSFHRFAEFGSEHRIFPYQRLGTHMNFIPTTATAAEKFKRLAKMQRKTVPSSLAVALDDIARQHGYAHWKHVTVCIEQTAVAATSMDLPPDLVQFLNSEAARHPASTVSRDAFARGLCFALDVKDAGEMLPILDCVECDDAWHIAARDVWRVLVYSKDMEMETSLFEMQSPEELLMTAQDDLSNYRFFRYAGAQTPASLDDAFANVFGDMFFAPFYVWLRGRFIDMSEVPEVRVDGRVVFSTSGGGLSDPSINARPETHEKSDPLTEEELALETTMTPEEKQFFRSQLTKQTPEGMAKFQSVQSSTTSSWRNAQKI